MALASISIAFDNAFAPHGASTSKTFFGRERCTDDSSSGFYRAALWPLWAQASRGALITMIFNRDAFIHSKTIATSFITIQMLMYIFIYIVDTIIIAITASGIVRGGCRPTSISGDITEDESTTEDQGPMKGLGSIEADTAGVPSDGPNLTTI